RLIALAHAIDPHPHPREMDMLISSGEQVTIALLAMALNSRGIPAHSLLAEQVPIYTNNIHTKARIESIDTLVLHELLDRGAVPIIAGFQGVTHEGERTTLGRGGSDTSAVAIAAVLKADECQIYTDVQ